MSNIIKPTVGRVVWFFPHVSERTSADGSPFVAVICAVQNDRSVNIAGLTDTGAPFSKLGVTLVQPGDTPPADGQHVEWRPHQIEKIVDELKVAVDHIREGLAAAHTKIDGVMKQAPAAAPAPAAPASATPPAPAPAPAT